MANAIGILETKGLVAAVKGADAMLKAASVSLTGPVKDAGGAYMSVQIAGDVASVKAAIDAGAQAASEVGKVLSAHVIARPSEELCASLCAAKPAAVKK